MGTQQERMSIRLAPRPTERARRALSGMRRMMRGNPTMIFAVIIIATVFFMAIFSPWLARTDYEQTTTDLRLAPSADHWFGTDNFGRDVFDRVLVGSRISLWVGFWVTFISVVAGVVIALFAGYFRWLDHVLMRFIDGLLAFPTVLLALALIALLGSSVNNVIIALSVTGTASKVRLVRGQVLSLREQQFVEATRAIGSPVWRILFLHIAPNTFGIVMVQATFTLAAAILAEASLSFLGLGVPEFVPTWGNIVATGRGYVQVAWWISFFPGLFLTLTVLAVVIIGDNLRDFLDPRLRGHFDQ